MAFLHGGIFLQEAAFILLFEITTITFAILIIYKLIDWHPRVQVRKRKSDQSNNTPHKLRYFPLLREAFFTCWLCLQSSIIQNSSSVPVSLTGIFFSYGLSISCLIHCASKKNVSQVCRDILKYISYLFFIISLLNIYKVSWEPVAKLTCLFSPYQHSSFIECTTKPLDVGKNLNTVCITCINFDLMMPSSQNWIETEVMNAPLSLHRTFTEPSQNRSRVLPSAGLLT